MEEVDITPALSSAAFSVKDTDELVSPKKSISGMVANYLRSLCAMHLEHAVVSCLTILLMKCPDYLMKGDK